MSGRYNPLAALAELDATASDPDLDDGGDDEAAPPSPPSSRYNALDALLTPRDEAAAPPPSPERSPDLDALADKLVDTPSTVGAAKALSPDSAMAAMADAAIQTLSGSAGEGGGALSAAAVGLDTPVVLPLAASAVGGAAGTPSQVGRFNSDVALTLEAVQLARPARDAARLLDFVQLAGQLRETKRTGWEREGVGRFVAPRVESVAEHSWRMALLSLLLATQAGGAVDSGRCVLIALVHDLAETIVGDITPEVDSGVSKAHKAKLERAAMEHACADVLGGGAAAELILGAWEEYEEGKSAEARVVKDADKLEMCATALEYEQSLVASQGVFLDLSTFADGVKGKLHTAAAEELLREVEERRAEGGEGGRGRHGGKRWRLDADTQVIMRTPLDYEAAGITPVPAPAWSPPAMEMEHGYPAGAVSASKPKRLFTAEPQPAPRPQWPPAAALGAVALGAVALGAAVSTAAIFRRR